MSVFMKFFQICLLLNLFLPGSGCVPGTYRFCLDPDPYQNYMDPQHWSGRGVGRGRVGTP